MSKQLKPLAVKALRCTCDPATIGFNSTTEVKALPDIMGQSRAIDAIQFGVQMKADGYNLYALGPHGVGKLSAIKKVLKQEANGKHAPADWCYVYNFNDPAKPVSLELPAGYGPKLAKDMDKLIDDLRSTIPAVFESEEYYSQLQQIAEKYAKAQEKEYRKLEEEAKQHEMSILNTQQGFVVTPRQEEGQKGERYFTEAELKEKEEVIKALTTRLEDFLKNIPKARKDQREEERNLQRGFAQIVVGYSVEELKNQYQDIKAVLQFLQQVEEDIVDNIGAFVQTKDKPRSPFQQTQQISFERYQINVFVTQQHKKKAPIIYEDNPTYDNLIGCIEYRSEMGALVTDFNLIKAGALHQANGGYLVLDAHKVLMHPYAWYVLKRALFSHKVHIESPSKMAGLLNTSTLEPEPINIDVKVILTGERFYYYLLCELDPDFQELFKVEADFNEEMPRNKRNIKQYAKLIAGLARQKKLRHLDKEAVAAVIDHTSRLAEDTEKVSIHMRSVVDLLREADFWAGKANKELVELSHIQKAIAQQIYRSDRVRERLHEQIERQFILLDTKGERVGQINGLSVIQFGGFQFGTPVRITATTRCGKGKVVDIQKEAELSGAIHSKGVLILEGYLNGYFAKEKPLSLSASLVFEQTYSMIEGDSASAAELCALLSDLAQLAIKQNLAITGSVNQHGEIQAIGGVNEKIEGFFEICKQKRLNGKQGVIIPEANVKNLMLKQTVVDAAQAGKFAVYSVRTIDEAITLLTGVNAGKRGKSGQFPKGSVNARVEQCLLDYARAEEGEGS